MMRSWEGGGGMLPAEAASSECRYHRQSEVAFLTPLLLRVSVSHVATRFCFCCRLDGRTESSEKERIVERFNESSNRKRLYMKADMKIILVFDILEEESNESADMGSMTIF
ncbi:hypothetical protein PIB30_006997 [Stylosanthes scabra]|uniref:Uncharacterized protein n=1 Tax=Stylosanthes scabra TaxID=79078 RepID=A0ABU6Z281_9FABA|nr:hypothetical protein [Stylosanthes scabra]